MKRLFDILLSFILLTLFSGLILLIYIIIRQTSQGPSIYWSNRIGINSKPFNMPKFRSMYIDTPAVATHLLKNPESYISPVGKFLRKYSLDELPQLISVLKGDMSFVGPRPALYNQSDLIELRKKAGVDKLMPGITGWAQVMGRDELSIQDKVSLEIEYLEHQSFWFDMKILFKTLLVTVKKTGVLH